MLSSGSLRKRIRGHPLLSVHSAAQRLVISVFAGVDNATDASSAFGFWDRAVTFSRVKVCGTGHIGHLPVVVGGVGGGGGVRDSDLASLECATLDRIDDFGEAVLMGAGGDGVSKSGADSAAWIIVSEVMPSLRHEPSP